jgi:hypothetical protein
MIDMSDRKLRPYSPGKLVYPALSDSLRLQWERIPPCPEVGSDARPCLVTLDDGIVIDNVYVVSAQEYIKVWGVWPKDDSWKKEIDISRVIRLIESPNRFPVKLAEKVYGGGESGMGYQLFTVLFKDESRQVYMTGNAVEFLPLPQGKSFTDMIDVFPHEGREASDILHGMNYYWCLFGTGESHTPSFKVSPAF